MGKDWRMRPLTKAEEEASLKRSAEADRRIRESVRRNSEATARRQAQRPWTAVGPV